MANQDEIKKQFSIKKKKQIIIAVILLPILFSSIFIAEHPAINKTGISDMNLILFALAIIIIGVLLSFLNWRCPNCNKYLGKQFNPKFCSKCGIELQ